MPSNRINIPLWLMVILSMACLMIPWAVQPDPQKATVHYVDHRGE